MPRARSLVPLQTLRNLQAQQIRKKRKAGLSAAEIREFRKAAAEQRAGLELIDRTISEANLAQSQGKKKKP